MRPRGATAITGARPPRAVARMPGAPADEPALAVDASCVLKAVQTCFGMLVPALLYGHRRDASLLALLLPAAPAVRRPGPRLQPGERLSICGKFAISTSGTTGRRARDSRGGGVASCTSVAPAASFGSRPPSAFLRLTAGNWRELSTGDRIAQVPEFAPVHPDGKFLSNHAR